MDDQKKQSALVIEEMTKLLRGQRIDPVDSHGWSGPDDVDSEAIGYAMWQTDGPTDELLDSVMMSDGASPPKVTKWQTICSVAGTDFEGLMNAARLSIGLALYQVHILGERLDDTDSLANVHLLSALMMLGAASDRLRDVFVAAVFQKTSRTYDKWKEPGATERWLFDTPFREALNLGKSLPRFEDALSNAMRLATENVPFRCLRNKLVHKLATELGRQRQSVIQNLSGPRADHSMWEKMSGEDYRAMIAQSEAVYAKKVLDAIEPPMQWYRLLIDTANEVFIVENVLRNAQSKAARH